MLTLAITATALFLVAFGFFLRDLMEWVREEIARVELDTEFADMRDAFQAFGEDPISAPIRSCKDRGPAT